jgi:hypothetical protein
MAGIQFIDVGRDRLYWDRFQYVMDFQLPWSSRMSRIFRSWPVSTLAMQYDPSSSADMSRVQNVQAVATVLLSFKDRCRTMITGDWVNLYTSDLMLLEQLSQMTGLVKKRYHRCVITRERDSVILRKTQHQYRTYFNQMCLDRPEKQRLLNFVNNRGDYFRITPGFRRRLESDWSWCNLDRTNFLDHHDSGDALMLNLVLPGIVRMTVPIQTK